MPNPVAPVGTMRSSPGMFSSVAPATGEPLPVIAKTGFLQHGEHFVVGQLSGRCAGHAGKGRLAVSAVHGPDPISGLHPCTAEKIAVAIDASSLNTDGLELVPFQGAVDRVGLQTVVLHRVPADVYVPIVAFSLHVLRRRWSIWWYTSGETGEAALLSSILISSMIKVRGVSSDVLWPKCRLCSLRG